MKIYVRIYIATQSTSDNQEISTTIESSATGRDYSTEMNTKDISELFGMHI